VSLMAAPAVLKSSRVFFTLGRDRHYLNRRRKRNSHGRLLCRGW
jgi:hypothetical protein